MLDVKYKYNWSKNDGKKCDFFDVYFCFVVIVGDIQVGPEYGHSFIVITGGGIQRKGDPTP